MDQRYQKIVFSLIAYFPILNRFSISINMRNPFSIVWIYIVRAVSDSRSRASVGRRWRHVPFASPSSAFRYVRPRGKKWVSYERPRRSQAVSMARRMRTTLPSAPNSPINPPPDFSVFRMFMEQEARFADPVETSLENTMSKRSFRDGAQASTVSKERPGAEAALCRSSRRKCRFQGRGAPFGGELRQQAGAAAEIEDGLPVPEGTPKVRSRIRGRNDAFLHTVRGSISCVASFQ